MKIENHELSVEELRTVCDPAQFPFSTTADLTPLDSIIGQKRAVSAMEFGFDITSPGFNVFVAGMSGTGKSSITRRLLERIAAEQPVPDDVAYVHNFDDPDSPHVLTLPPGIACRLRAGMQELVEDLQDHVPKAFEGKDYEEQRRQTAEQHQESKQQLMEKLEEGARKRGFELKSTPMGFRTIPIHDGKPLTQEEYEEMEDGDRKSLDEQMEELEGEVREVMAEIKIIEQALKDELRDLNQQVAMNVLGALMLHLKQSYQDYELVIKYLDTVQKDIVDNIEHFREQEEPAMPIPGLRVPRQEPDFSRYEVNVVVDNTHTKGAPVVFETNPTFANLVGRIERRAQFGALLTDFTMIRAGSLAKANGGFLVLNVEDLLRNPFVYDALKRAMRDREVRIEDLAERFGVFETQTLRPEPIPLRAKVCLLGNPHWYHTLFYYDEDFGKIFKVKADFDYQTDREDHRIHQLAAFIARLSLEESLPPADPTAVAAVVDHASRIVEDKEKMSLRFSELTDLIREAAYWAKVDGKDIITSEQVGRALDEQEFRTGLIKDRVQELILREVLLVDTDGAKTGQINGLAIHVIGQYMFGRPSRITANVHLGREGVINIERRARLSHSTHDKGVMILSGFLGERFAQDKPMSLSATLTFEQSYGEIAGDSASSTELYCLLSALAEVPLKQGIAVTGSVNQKGEVQAIGGVNHKIEGYFDICVERGLTGEQGVMIPRANVQYLMLREDVVEAVAEGKFRVWAIDHVDEGIEILTDVPAGERQEDGDWTPDSINYLVDTRLEDLGKRLRDWGRDGSPSSAAEVVTPHDGEESPPPQPPERPNQ